MFKFIHAADIHLDSPMRGLPNYEGAPIDEIRGATRRALEAMVDLAIEEQVGFVLIAGDLFDGDWPDFNTGLFFAREMARLAVADIKTVIVSGNHDAASQITERLSLPPNAIQLSTEAPETQIFGNLGVAIHGLGFGERHVTENVTQRYPQAVPGVYNIGMLHTSAGRAGHDEYAPCSVQNLTDRGYQYWALGHIHKREMVQEDPRICFPGNLQGRNIRETGPKGCLLVTVDGADTQVEERNLELVRWELCEVPSADCRDGQDVIGRIQDVLARLLDRCEAPVLAARIEVTGDSPAVAQLLANQERWTNEARQAAIGLGQGRLWVEKLKISPGSPDPDASGSAALDDSALAILHTQSLTSDGVDALGEEADVRALMDRLPSELLEGDESLTWCEELASRLAPSARVVLSEALRDTAGGDAQ